MYIGNGRIWCHGETASNARRPSSEERLWVARLRFLLTRWLHCLLFPNGEKYKNLKDVPKTAIIFLYHPTMTTMPVRVSEIRCEPKEIHSLWPSSNTCALGCGRYTVDHCSRTRPRNGDEVQSAEFISQGLSPSSEWNSDTLTTSIIQRDPHTAAQPVTCQCSHRSHQIHAFLPK